MIAEQLTDKSGSLLRIPDAAQILQVSPRTIWRMIAEGQLTAVRFRRCTRVALAEVRKLMTGGHAIGV